jgi:hypothetical protein
MSDIQNEEILPIANEIYNKNDIIEIVIFNPNEQLNIGIPLNDHEGSAEILGASLNRSNLNNYCNILPYISIIGIILLIILFINWNSSK